MDDSTYNLFVISEILKSIDSTFIIDTALNGEQAIEVVLEKSRNSITGVKGYYDFIFMDLQMPVLDGF